MIRALLAFALVAPSAPLAAPSPVGEPMTLVVHLSPDAASPNTGSRAFEVVPGRHVDARSLDAGESVEGALVEVLGDAAGPPVRVQVQYETSVSIANSARRGGLPDWKHFPSPVLAFAGPRLELSDWKHHTSPWVDLVPDAQGRFRVGTLGPDARSQFPPIDRAELIEAVRAAGGDAWADLVQDASGPTDAPATVGLSAIRLRLVYGTPEATFVVEFPMPEGC